MLKPSFLAPGIASHVASEHAHRSWRWQRARAFFKALKLASHVGNVAGKAFLALATWLARLGVDNLILALATWLAAHSGVGNLAGSTFWRWQPGWQHLLALATWLAPKTWCLAKLPFLALPRNTPMIPGVGNALEVVSYGAKVAWRCLE